MTYYNTTSLSGQGLETATKKTLTQADLILKLFLYNGNGLTPFQVQKWLMKYGKNYPITSIRRAINTLTNQGHLVKLDEFRTGQYGAKNHLWKIKK